MRPSFAAFNGARRGNILISAAAMFALGVVTDAALRPSPTPQGSAPVATARAATVESATPRPEPPLSQRLNTSFAYPAEVLRVIDGDTFEARVRVWPGLDVDTKVRLRGIDAAELHARCSEELAKAETARGALETILGEGGVSISQVGIDKYGGRVDAAVATKSTPDVSAAMLGGGYARAYDGRKRESWCG